MWSASCWLQGSAIANGCWSFAEVEFRETGWKQTSYSKLEIFVFWEVLILRHGWDEGRLVWRLSVGFPLLFEDNVIFNFSSAFTSALRTSGILAEGKITQSLSGNTNRFNARPLCRAGKLSICIFEANFLSWCDCWTWSSSPRCRCPEFVERITPRCPLEVRTSLWDAPAISCWFSWLNPFWIGGNGSMRFITTKARQLEYIGTNPECLCRLVQFPKCLCNPGMLLW
jgi:hypothetical protein